MASRPTSKKNWQKKSINKCEEFIGISTEDYEEIIIGEMSATKIANLIKKK